MDLCGPMRVQTINGKKYILVIVDDYSRFTWVKFLRSKDDTQRCHKFLKLNTMSVSYKNCRFIRYWTMKYWNLSTRICYDYMKALEFFHQKTVQGLHMQNGVAKRRKTELCRGQLAMLSDPKPFVNVFTPDLTSEASSSGEIMMLEPNQSTQPREHIRKCRNEKLKSACTDDCWFKPMQEEIHGIRFETYGNIPPSSAMIIALEWIYKVKLDEYGDVLKNKARLVAKGFVKKKV
ncbi:retrovirus-related pol polyprotein from transposon TNT 1-94 [Tanacetum coccineum]